MPDEPQKISEAENKPAENRAEEIRKMMEAAKSKTAESNESVEVEKKGPMTKEESITTPVSTGRVEVKPANKEIEVLEKKLREIIRKYKQVSNIPLTHEYWTLKNHLRGLRNE